MGKHQVVLSLTGNVRHIFVTYTEETDFWFMKGMKFHPFIRLLTFICLLEYWIVYIDWNLIYYITFNHLSCAETIICLVVKMKRNVRPMKGSKSSSLIFQLFSFYLWSLSYAKHIFIYYWSFSSQSKVAQLFSNRSQWVVTGNQFKHQLGQNLCAPLNPESK